MTKVLGPLGPGYAEILSPEALAFVAALVREIRDGRKACLEARRTIQARYDQGERPDFLRETESIRTSEWKVAPIPADLQDRRVEITGPVDRKMIINALNSGANVFMADFEDSTAPTWANVIEGQLNLRDAIRGTIRYVDEQKQKTYALNEKVATLFVRPRGWHLLERHFLVDGEPAPGGVFDFGLYFFHNAKALLQKGSGPYFYLPKLEHHEEAKLWNQVFVKAQSLLGIPQGTIRATVLIETLPASFQMNEILWALKDHSAGLNCGRWDYIFSYIKTLRGHPEAILPDRGQVGMTQPMMKAYSELVIQTCHRRGIHAMGGMAAQIPIKDDPAKNEAALQKVKADKLREVKAGHDGTWVAHPGLVPVAKAIFDEHLKTPNQISNLRLDLSVKREDLLTPPTGARTEAGLRMNLEVGVRYLEAWLRGIGCVPLHDLMEDAATAEISRTQVWQWLRHGAHLDDGRTVDQTLVERLLAEETERLTGGKFTEARHLFLQLCTQSTLESFLTLPAYEALVAGSAH
ncbi:MAG: malate synthase A [Deltaproteobacteria bacterium]|nr:malate synthase A [Deltaproteobacteria bacterium]